MEKYSDYVVSQMGEAVCNIDAVELSHVCINDTVSFKLKMVEIGEEKELQMVMKAVVVQDGTELCTVGFLGKNIAALEKTRFRYQDKFAQIIELHDKSDNQTKRSRSNQNLGVASFLLFDDIQS